MNHKITLINIQNILALVFLALVPATQAKNVVEVLSSRAEFSTLVTAVTEAGLVTALEEIEDVTIFAPDNHAFAKIPPADLRTLLADKETLQAILFYHVSPGAKSYYDLEGGSTPTLLDGEEVDIEVKTFFRFLRRVNIDEATITRANIQASNGIIHRINQVLDPEIETLPSIFEIAATNPDFSILAELVTEAGLTRALSQDYRQLTVFAPTDDAFRALGDETIAAVRADKSLLRDILRNHIALGSLDSDALGEAGNVRTALGLTLPIAAGADSTTGLSVDGKPINAANIPASNGIVHVVGEVLVPPAPQSLVDVASSREDLSTFVFVLGEAGLSDTFDSTKRWPAYTIFAPNNEAFRAIPQLLLDQLLLDPTGQLADILKLHVVPGRLPAEKLFDGQVLYSLAGKKLTVGINEGVVTINNAVVAETNLEAENGVLHVLQDVIAADAFTIADFVKSKSHLSTLEAALDAAMLTDALDDDMSKLTLFAPLNSAFGKLPDGTVPTLLEKPEGLLKDILLYHVSPNARTAGELVATGTADTLLGPTVSIEKQSFRFWRWFPAFSIVEVNGNRVISADIEVDNGIIHLITGVLLPPEGE